MNQLVEERELIEAAQELAHRIVSNPGQAAKMTMEAANRGLEMPLDYGLRLESSCAVFVIKLRVRKRS